MTDSLKIAEQMVVQLIATTNRSHAGATWRYELTSEVDNIEVVAGGGAGHGDTESTPCGSTRAGCATSCPRVTSSPAWPTRSRPGTSSCA